MSEKHHEKYFFHGLFPRCLHEIGSLHEIARNIRISETFIGDLQRFLTPSCFKKTLKDYPLPNWLAVTKNGVKEFSSCTEKRFLDCLCVGETLIFILLLTTAVHLAPVGRLWVFSFF